MSLKDLPDFWLGKYRCDPYVCAATQLQSIGMEAAVHRLSVLCEGRRTCAPVVALCRMLFVPKAGVEFRPPGIGAMCFLGGTDSADWPLEPIELVAGVPLLIADGYVLMGCAESASSYLRWCLANCAWSPCLFEPRSPAAKTAALLKLLRSEKWKRPLDERERSFLSRQIG